MPRPDTVRIVEVGARDGLQNEALILPLETRLELLHRLSETGLRTIEAGSFVSPRWVPQMAGSDELFRSLHRKPGVSYTALTPNLQGFERAKAAGVSEVAVFASASEAFSQKNINCSVAESIERFRRVCEAASAIGLPVRGYVSCAIACPYSGPVAPQAVSNLTRQLLDLDCYEVSIGDTIGVGTPAQVQEVLDCCLSRCSAEQLAVHFHDTYGQALANVYAALEMGVAVVDSSIAGLGGCPYASGASGNVPTEDVVYMLHGLGLRTGLDLTALIETGNWICAQLDRRSSSKVALAGYTRTKPR